MTHRFRSTPRALCLLALLACTGGVVAAQEVEPPETFLAIADITGQDAAAILQVTIRIDRYTPESDRTRMLEALRLGGYPRLLPVLRAAPEVGYVEMSGRKATMRWARQIPNAGGRAISIVTDSPLFFVGGGNVEAKPRAGFDLAVIQLQVDASGTGTGTIAAAARIRPGGETGIQIDDYAEEPVALTDVEKTD